MNCYSVYCKPIKAHNRPFVAVNDKEAVILVRNVLLSADDKELKSNPADYDLVFVGEFDNVRGTYSGKRRLVCHIGDIPLPTKVEQEVEENEV